MDEALGRITREFGAPEVVVHNAIGGVFGNFQEIDPAALERNFQINVMALLHLVRRTAPSMIEAGRGVIIPSGNASALRGKANFAGFAPSKATHGCSPNRSRVSSDQRASMLPTSSSTR